MTHALTEADLAAADAETHGLLGELDALTGGKPVELWEALAESTHTHVPPSEPARIGLDLGEMSRRRWWQFWGNR